MKFQLSNTLSLQIFQIIRVSSLFLISILLVKASVPVKEIGFYEITLFLSNILTFFWITGLIQAFLPMYQPNSNEYVKSSDLFNVFLVICCFSILFGVFGLLLKTTIQKIEGVSDLPFYPLVMLYTSISSPTSLIEYIYLLKNKPNNMVYYGVISYFSQILLVVLPLLLGLGIKASIYGLIVISAIRFIWLTILVLKNSSHDIQSDFIKRYLAIGTPLALKYLISSSGAFIDGLIVSSKYNAATFAVFRYGARELPFVNILSNSLSNSMLPNFSDKTKIHDTLKQIRVKSYNMMLWLFPFTILLIFVCKPIYPWVFDSNFSSSANIFLIYLLLIISRLVFPQTIILGFGKTGMVLAASVIELLLNVSLSLILLNRIGLEGVALATVLVFLIEKIILIFYSYKKFQIKPSEYIPLKAYFTFSAITILSYLIARFML
ncbi:MAG: hypothetical protein EHM93_06200 [Bacteroidales bacterium]|nr:MAG: hypothetical protein EHM93_06200 [Bacteroidales bacterium]